MSHPICDALPWPIHIPSALPFSSTVVWFTVVRFTIGRDVGRVFFNQLPWEKGRLVYTSMQYASRVLRTVRSVHRQTGGGPMRKLSVFFFLRFGIVFCSGSELFLW